MVRLIWPFHDRAISVAVVQKFTCTIQQVVRTARLCRQDSTAHWSVLFVSSLPVLCLKASYCCTLEEKSLLLDGFDSSFWQGCFSETPCSQTGEGVA